MKWTQSLTLIRYSVRVMGYVVSFFHSVCPLLFLCSRALRIKALLLTVKQTLPEALSQNRKCGIPDVVLFCLGALNIFFMLQRNYNCVPKDNVFPSLLFRTFGGHFFLKVPNSMCCAAFLKDRPFFN